MKHYRYGIIDKSILLHRNYQALKHAYKDRLTAGLLLKSCIQSIFRIPRDFIEVDRLIIVNDAKPYHKSKIIESLKGKSEYKADRPKDADPSKFLEIYGGASYGLSEFCNKFGILNVKYAGYEADDLAYILGQELSTPDDPVVLISFDSDWFYLTSPNVHYFNLREKKCYDYSMCCRKVGKPTDLKMLDYMILQSAFLGSHNNLKCVVSDKYKKVPVQKLLEHYLAGRAEVFTDMKLAEAQIKSWNIKGFPNYDEIVEFSHTITPTAKFSDVQTFRDFIKKYDIDLSIDSYKRFRESLKK